MQVSFGGKLQVKLPLVNGTLTVRSSARSLPDVHAAVMRIRAKPEAGVPSALAILVWVTVVREAEPTKQLAKTRAMGFMTEIPSFV
jgi:nitrous oxidase accessory protein NosD